MGKTNLIFKSIFATTIVFTGLSVFAQHGGLLPSQGDIIKTEEITKPITIDENRSRGREIAVYSGRSVHFKGQSSTTSVPQIITNNSKIMLFNPKLLPELKFPFASNILPKKEASLQKAYSVANDGGIYLGNKDVKRGELSAQICFELELRGINTNLSTSKTNSKYFIKKTESGEPQAYSINGNDNLLFPQKQYLTGCDNLYIAYCGDGVVDKKGSEVKADGVGGIITQEGNEITWALSPIKDEVCDDGKDNGKPGKCKTDCSGYGNGEVGKMIVTKALATEQKYSPQDTLQFRINFSNPGKDRLEKIKIEDFLPQGFEYISSEIHGVQGATLSTGKDQSDFLIVYQGFSLDAGKEGYILINAKVLTCNNILNIAKREATSNGQKIDGNTSKQVLCNTDPIRITKTANPSTVPGGHNIGFTITVNNATNETINNVRVEDIWPACISFVDGSAKTSLESSQSHVGNTTQWTTSTPLKPGDSFTIYFSGQASDSASCIGTHTNTGRVFFKDAQGNSQTQTNTSVSITQASHNILIKKETTQDGFGPGDIVVYRISYTNYGSQAVQSFKIKDYRPNTLEFIKADPRPSTTTNPLQNPIVWNINTPLQPGGTGEIIVTAKIKTDLK